MADGVGAGEPRGDRRPGHREDRQWPVGGRRAEPAGQHPAPCASQRYECPVGMCQGDGRGDRDRGVHREHRRTGRKERYRGLVGRVQQLHEVMQDHLPRAQHGDDGGHAAAAPRKARERAREQREQHHQYGEVRNRPTGRSVPHGGEQRARPGEHGGAEQAATGIALHGPRR
jgi:hypothetical protein